ncbi:IS1634 family transposase [Peloplasma aerotolerans]|uniref:IS1634 family transposase n=1 Tax=Peloplasma aerotolerans TaxID=3044389 RepID=A0AAW6UAC1_9MOLU|nr:IS1634 family transposase [Mariniplasma sp. M4Ah]MDI6453805.1 IS1634 family transposase [Mariniplasma sp. M4Ah]
MFIRVTTSPDKKFSKVYLVEGYRDEKGKVKQRIVENLGDLDTLTQDNPNALKDLKIWAKEETKRLKGKLPLEVFFSDLQTESDSLFNYGYVFLERLYHRIGLSSYMQNYQSKVKCQYNLDEILKLLVFSRCLNPGSKKKAYERKGNYFFEFSDFKLEDIYKSLDYLAEVKDDLTLAMHERINETYKRDCTLVFYDVTNYYFESEETSELRQRGVSKEKKKTGIIQMGLFIDRNGIPITYELFPGHTNDLSTMRPILEKIKKQYNLGKITIIADKGNNSGKNLDYIDKQKDHYIISQKIRQRGNGLADIVLDQEDYITNSTGTFKYKTVERDHEIKEDGKVISTIKEHLLCFWSLKEERYQHGKRGLLDEKIDKFISDPSLLNASNSFGVKKYFKKTTYDKTTGEIVKTKNSYTFDQEKYERDIALDGYYAIVTNDLDLTPFEIIDHYRQLSVIEDSFRVTKTDLEGRPVYVWTDNHIKGHFLTCFIALTLYRLLQLETNNEYSVNRLKEALNSAVTMKLSKGVYILPNTTATFKSLSERYELNYKYLRYETFKTKLNNILHNK